MNRRQTVPRCLLTGRVVASTAVCLLLLANGCSSRRNAETKTSSDSEKRPDASGVIAGTAQLALKSGDVKNIAFASVVLTKQNYKVLTGAEQADIAFDVDSGRDAVQLGMMSSDELQTKAKAKFAAMESFQSKLPEKLKVPPIATETTNANGEFRFSNVCPGTYWIFLDTKVAINYVGWSLRVEVKPGETVKADLNNTNVDYSFY